jgi:Na+/melibiose symporter-like transporter
MGMTAGTFKGNTIPKFTKFYYPFSGIFRDACYALVGTFLLQYTMFSGVLSEDPATYTEQMHVITIALMIALIWDGLDDPIMGIIVERCHFKTGKFRPWILIGAIGNALMVAMMFTIRPTNGDGWGYVAMMIVFYLLWDLVFTMNDIGYWSMLPSLTSDEKERNSITTRVTIATTIGGFVMNIALFILPGLVKASTATIYAVVAVITSILFLISQALVFFLCKEHERDPKQDAISAKTQFKDLFTVLKNKPLRMTIWGILLDYFAGGLLTGIGLNYFYFEYGYGGSKGGLLASGLSIVYVIGTLLAQSLYTLIAKKWTKHQILTFTFSVIIIGYLAFLFLGFPLFGDRPIAYPDETKSGAAWLFSGTLPLLYIPAFFFFAAQGVFYICLLVMMQNAIDYHEFKYGERKESVAFSWRPLDAKFSSSLQKGIMNLTYIISGTYYSAVVPLSNLEGQLNSKAIDQETFNSAVDAVINGGTVTINGTTTTYTAIQSSQLAIIGYIVIGIILVSWIAAYLLLRFGYTIDEKQYAEIVKKLEIRHEEDAKALAAETPDATLSSASDHDQNIRS